MAFHLEIYSQRIDRFLFWTERETIDEKVNRVSKEFRLKKRHFEY